MGCRWAACLALNRMIGPVVLFGVEFENTEQDHYGKCPILFYIYCSNFKKQAMIRIFAMLFAVLTCFAAFSQQSANKDQVPAQQQKLDALKGTYELKKTSRNVASLPSNLAEIIENNRKEGETNTISLNQDVQLIIYPKKQIAPTGRDGK
jgi:hypothetical protein